MGKLQTIVDTLNRMTPEVQEQVLLHILQDNEPSFVDANTGQLLEGRDSKDVFLRSYKNPNYAEFKKTLNPKGVTDLKLSGDFHRGFFLDASSFPVQIFSTDDKTDDLINEYGSDIFGLTKPKLSQVVKGQVLFDVQDFYRSIILGL